MNQQSQVEQFWDKIKLHFGDTRTWNELNPMEAIKPACERLEQHAFIQGINSIMSVFIK